jgi:hypothetical protein
VECLHVVREVFDRTQVYVNREPPCVHIYDVVSHGRRFLRTLVFASSAA